MSIEKKSVAQTGLLLPYMRDVAACEQSLQELSLMWRIIEASARMNCPTEAKTILSTLAATRTGFHQLEQALIVTLAQEKAANVLQAIGTKAGYVIDLIVRNLFERTADVGFLATDSELCAYVAGLHDDREAIQARLRDYRSKYTVYNEIVLLDLDGTVLANIDPASRLTQCAAPLLAATLGSDGYVESFGVCDLRPGDSRTLVYSRRMHHPHTGAVVGVLCLCFDFEAEMAGIFRTHRDTTERAIMLLLDGENRVIASGQPGWIAPGTPVPVNPDGAAAPLLFCGRHYLVRTVASSAYQGYPGPAGWQGQVMIPLDIAFGTGADANAAAMLQALEPAVAEGLLAHADTFCPALHAIMATIGDASDAIRRIVWNGHLLTAGEHGDMQKLKSVLDQISDTGNRSSELFAQATNDLFQTVLGAGMREAEFASHLLVDLLERNLYERADDCRWWALAPTLCSALAMPVRDAATIASMQATLETINGLYTVYTRIFVYDSNGVIVAGTGPLLDEDLGAFDDSLRRVDADTLASVLGLQDPQQYHVSRFAPSPLYADDSTFIYHAALRDPQRQTTVVGGIGIVFDSRPELHNMLRAGLGNRANGAAFFLERDGTILSSTDSNHAVGSSLPLDADLAAVGRGESRSKIVVHDGRYAILACTASSGYREFTISACHREEVLAVVIESFGALETGEHGSAPRHAAMVAADSISETGEDYATFFVGPNLLALPAAQVSQARPFSEVLSSSIGARPECVGLIDLDRLGGTEAFVWVFDLGHLLDGRRSRIDANSEVLILQQDGRSFGLLVNRLHEVPRFGQDQIVQMPFKWPGSTIFASRMIKANAGRLLIQLLDAKQLVARLLHDIDTPPEVLASPAVEPDPSSPAGESPQPGLRPSPAQAHAFLHRAA